MKPGTRLRWLWLSLRHGSHHLSIYPPGHERYSTRALEAYLALVDILFGAIVMLPIWDTLDPAIYDPLLRVVPHEEFWGAALAARGLIHGFALRINGAAWWTPYLRALASGWSALCYVLFVITLIWDDAFLPGLVFTVALVSAGAHLYCLRRSGRDAGIARAAR